VIVADTNLVAYLLIDGDRTLSARQLWQQDPDWHLPVLWRHEFLNVLASYARHSQAPIADIQELWRLALNLFTDKEHEADMEDAVQLAISYRISAYDAQFVSLAQTLGTILVTEDRQLLKQFPEHTRSLHKKP